MREGNLSSLASIRSVFPCDSHSCYVDIPKLRLLTRFYRFYLPCCVPGSTEGEKLFLLHYVFTQQLVPLAIYFTEALFDIISQQYPSVALAELEELCTPGPTCSFLRKVMKRVDSVNEELLTKVWGYDMTIRDLWEEKRQLQLIARGCLEDDATGMDFSAETSGKSALAVDSTSRSTNEEVRETVCGEGQHGDCRNQARQGRCWLLATRALFPLLDGKGW